MENPEHGFNSETWTACQRGYPFSVYQVWELANAFVERMGYFNSDGSVGYIKDISKARSRQIGTGHYVNSGDDGLYFNVFDKFGFQGYSTSSFLTTGVEPRGGFYKTDTEYIPACRSSISSFDFLASLNTFEPDNEMKKHVYTLRDFCVEIDMDYDMIRNTLLQYSFGNSSYHVQQHHMLGERFYANYVKFFKYVLQYNQFILVGISGSICQQIKYKNLCYRESYSSFNTYFNELKSRTPATWNGTSWVLTGVEDMVMSDDQFSTFVSNKSSGIFDGTFEFRDYAQRYSHGTESSIVSLGQYKVISTYSQYAPNGQNIFPNGYRYRYYQGYVGLPEGVASGGYIGYHRISYPELKFTPARTHSKSNFQINVKVAKYDYDYTDKSTDNRVWTSKETLTVKHGDTYTPNDFFTEDQLKSWIKSKMADMYCLGIQFEPTDPVLSQRPDSAATTAYRTQLYQYMAYNYKQNYKYV